MAFHEHATPNFRNLFVRPLWMTLKTMLRTFPIIGRSDFLRQHNGGAPYHGEQTMMFSPEEMKAHEAADAAVVGQTYAADRETSELFPHFERPLTIMYPYERLEEMEEDLLSEFVGFIGSTRELKRNMPYPSLILLDETRPGFRVTTFAAARQLGIR